MAAFIRITDTSGRNGSNNNDTTMSLIDQVFAICQKYKNDGWGDLFLSVANLNISQVSAGNLETELARSLTTDGVIDRTIPGFQDFNTSGVRGIEPGNPSRSLLYHAFASPGVAGDSLKSFLTIAELEAVENYIFASAKRSLDTVKGLAKGKRVALCVFAYEYRAGINTPNQKNADLCFSRTGVSRVGNKDYFYEPKSRGFVPWKEGDEDYDLRVVPVRYAAYLAVGLEGDDDEVGTFGPMGKNFLYENPDLDYTPMGNLGTEVPDDDDLLFWVPLHKLFSGEECLTNYDSDGGLNVSLSASHVNEKLARIQSELSSKYYDTGWAGKGYDFTGAPFTQTDELAAFLSDDAALGKNTLVPCSQAIVEQAVAKGEGLTFNVEEYDSDVDGGFDVLFASFNVEADEKTGAHRAPEYINVKQRVGEEPGDLNTVPDVSNVIQEGDYKAKSYVDFTADGWIEAIVPQLYTELTEKKCYCAYSLVSPPHLIPYVTQREIIVWTEERMANYEEWPRLWSVIPWALSEDRIAPNVELKRAGGEKEVFDLKEQTISAIVSLPEDPDVVAASLEDYGVKRSVTLPDAAAGTYAPGWDTSYDVSSTGKPFLSAYGLGSPFPEDAMICSALGSFWPTAAPDTTRIYAPMEDPRFRTVAPLTNEEIGMGSGVAWDGTPAPVVTTTDDGTIVTYTNINYNDYVQGFIDRKFTIKLLQKIDAEEYKNRVLAMYHAYSALVQFEYGPSGNLVSLASELKNTELWSYFAHKWVLLSFESVAMIPLKAIAEAGLDAKAVGGPYYKMRMFKKGCVTQNEPAFNKVQVEVTVDTDLYACPLGVIFRNDETGGEWREGDIPS